MVKFFILLATSVLVYSVFWFFKIGQVEKQINKFINENSTQVSAGEISASGFPLSQKITIKDLKFTLPTPLLNKRQVAVKHLEARAGIFSSEFSVALIGDVSVYDSNNDAANIAFSKDPSISILIANGRISKFNYQDFGYRILDAEKNVIYAASESNIHLESRVDDSEKVTSLISANIKDIEGFDVMDAYKNVLEKKIIDGIKTGEIAIGNASKALIPTQLDAVQTLPAATPSVPAAVNPPVVVAVATTTPSTTPAAATPADSEKSEKGSADLAVIENKNLIKNNFSIDLEYVLTPIQGEAQAQIPSDPTQIQEVSVQYSKALKINSLEFSNPLYKISVNGETATFPDDSMLSGSAAVKVENVSALIDYISAGFNQMSDQKKVSADNSQSLVASGLPNEDSYQNFLKKASANLGSVVKELAAKNAVSKEEIAEFDIRREKNLELLINETSIREILGKF